eukprot:superscaffoldBa00004941_g19668
MEKLSEQHPEDQLIKQANAWSFHSDGALDNSIPGAKESFTPTQSASITHKSTDGYTLKSIWIVPSLPSRGTSSSGRPGLRAERVNVMLTCRDVAVRHSSARCKEVPEGCIQVASDPGL